MKNMIRSVSLLFECAYERILINKKGKVFDLAPGKIRMRFYISSVC